MQRFIPKSRTFYVYEHWRPDKDVCFWVGKGKGGRAYIFKRNSYYDRVVAKLSRLGMCVEVRLVASNLSDEEAKTLEAERISFWRSAGVKLTNMTDGGDGSIGLKHTSATKAKLSRMRKGSTLSLEIRAKIGAAQRGMKRSETTKLNIKLSLLGHEVSDETKKKIGKSHQKLWASASQEQRERHGELIKKGLPKDYVWPTGWKLSPETKLKMSLAHKGRKHSEAAKLNMSRAQLGRRCSATQRATMRRAQQERRKREKQAAILGRL